MISFILLLMAAAACCAPISPHGSQPQGCAPLGNFTQKEYDNRYKDEKYEITMANVASDKITCSEPTFLIFFGTDPKRMIPAKELTCTDGVWSPKGYDGLDITFNPLEVACARRIYPTDEPKKPIKCVDRGKWIADDTTNEKVYIPAIICS